MSQSDEESFFPSIILKNDYYLGDSILLEPIAHILSELYNTKVYISSAFPELFENHPSISGLLPNITMPNTRIIDMSQSIRSITKEGQVLNNKYDNMYMQAGISNIEKYPPQLYLSDKEIQLSSDLKDLFSGKNIALALWSRHGLKKYPFAKLLVKNLSKAGYNIFLIHDKPLDIHYPNVIHLINKPIRNLMVYLNFMDVVIGVDTGILHLTGALNKQMIVLLYNKFYNLYSVYNKCIPLIANYTRFGLYTIPVNTICSISKELLYSDKFELVKEVPKKEPIKVIENVAIARMRGLGDILLTLPAIATYKKLYPERKITYITSKAGEKLLSLSALPDNVIGVDYDHGYNIDEPLPEMDYSGYDKVYNLINKVDFNMISKDQPRTQMFGDLIEIPQIDYSLKWYPQNLPDEWIANLWNKLRQYNISEKDRLLVLQTHSMGLSRMWPHKRQLEFVGLASKYHYKVILVNHEKIKDYPGKSINLTGKLTIEDFIAILNIASVIVSPDSGSVHIGGWLRRPTIGLFGSVDPKLRISNYDTVYPIVGKASCVPCNDWSISCCKTWAKPLQCMMSITAKEVIQKVRAIDI